MGSKSKQERIGTAASSNRFDPTEASKSQPLMCSEDLSIPSFQVIVMNANMGCTSCRERVFQVLAKITGLKEYIVDVRNKQVIIKGDVRFPRSTKDDAS
ncbi:hypothetical protein Ancab_015004 [Ancistrocladus abbreviatus]